MYVNRCGVFTWNEMQPNGEENENGDNDTETAPEKERERDTQRPGERRDGSMETETGSLERPVKNFQQSECCAPKKKTLISRVQQTQFTFWVVPFSAIHQRITSFHPLSFHNFVAQHFSSLFFVLCFFFFIFITFPNSVALTACGYGFQKHKTDPEQKRRMKSKKDAIVISGMAHKQTQSKHSFSFGRPNTWWR